MKMIAWVWGLLALVFLPLAGFAADELATSSPVENVVEAVEEVTETAVEAVEEETEETVTTTAAVKKTEETAEETTDEFSDLSAMEEEENLADEMGGIVPEATVSDEKLVY